MILENHEFLLDLNTSLTEVLLKLTGIEKYVSYTTSFMPPGATENDFRYKITPKKKSTFPSKEYIQVFNTNSGFIPGLSIIDLVFNIGPEAVNYI